MNILYVFNKQDDALELIDVLKQGALNIKSIGISEIGSINGDFEQFDLVLIDEVDSVIVTKELLKMIFKTSSKPLTKKFRTILLTNAADYTDIKLESYVKFMLSGNMLCMLRENAKRDIIRYVENQYVSISMHPEEDEFDYSSYKILVVDDSAVYRNLVSKALGEVGYSVTTAVNGKEALELHMSGHFDVVITDIEMPEMSGIELCEKIRDNDKYIEIIFISSLLDKKTVDQVYHIGAGDFFGKPLDLDRLIRKIETHYNVLKQKTAFKTLVLDSDPEYRKQLCLELKQNALPAFEGVNGIEGLTITLVENIHAVITNDDFTILNGYEYLSALNHAMETEKIIKIVISDSFEPRKMKSFANNMSIEFYPKSTDFFEIINHVEQQLFKRVGYSKREIDLFLSSIRSLIVALEARDKYTRGHSERVRFYSELIANELELSPKQKDLLSLAAILHDIGKITVPDAVLLKPGALTDEEYEMIKRHTAVGYKILKPIKSLSYVAEIIKQHHERIDGKGYPEALNSNEITLEARIIAVADTFDAMTSERPYRMTMITDEAIKRLEAAKNGQLDERCVDALLRVIEKGQAVPSRDISTEDI